MLLDLMQVTRIGILFLFQVFAFVLFATFSAWGFRNHSQEKVTG
jgi:hypothetical protein